MNAAEKPAQEGLSVFATRPSVARRLQRAMQLPPPNGGSWLSCEEA